MQATLEQQVRDGLKGGGGPKSLEIGTHTFPSGPGTDVEARLDALEQAVVRLGSLLAGLARLTDQRLPTR